MTATWENEYAVRMPIPSGIYPIEASLIYGIVQLMLPFDGDCRYLIFHPVRFATVVKWQMKTRRIALVTLLPLVVAVYGRRV